MTKEQGLLEQAKKLAATAETWADFSNDLFSPGVGILSVAYPDRAEREAFMDSKEYRAIRELVEEVRERTGLVEGATPKKTDPRFPLLFAKQ
jgi:hypothetical protein